MLQYDCVGAQEFTVRGFFEGQEVLAANVVLFSHTWTLLLPVEPVVIDELILPAGVDFDSLIVHVDSLQGFFVA